MSGSYDHGPYIPSAHERYDLLPRCRANGGEVFSYPEWLGELEDLVRDAGVFEDDDPGSGKQLHFMPYGYDSYAEYQSMRKGWADRCRPKDAELADAILGLGREIDRLNVKENWSVVRYVGTQLDDDPCAASLTKGRCYYWPCSKEKPIYEGVIDNEEFTSYLYPCAPDSWEIVEDPTGMAARALAGEADTVSFWRFDEQEGAPFAELIEKGAMPKMQRGAPTYFEEEPQWGESERDPVNFKCPQCGGDIDFMAWTKLNRQDAPEAYEMLLGDRLSEFVCPACGYTASIVHPCLFLDPDAKACVYHVVDERMENAATEMFEALRDDAGFECDRFRIVTSRQDLAEKARLLKAGLDDRAIEILKFGISGNAKMEGLVAVDESCEVRFRSVGEDGHIEFGLEIGDRRYASRIDIRGYELFSDTLQRSSLADDQPFRVDRNWASMAMDCFDAEGIH